MCSGSNASGGVPIMVSARSGIAFIEGGVRHSKFERDVITGVEVYSIDLRTKRTIRPVTLTTQTRLNGVSLGCGVLSDSSIDVFERVCSTLILVQGLGLKPPVLQRRDPFMGAQKGSECILTMAQSQLTYP